MFFCFLLLKPRASGPEEPFPKPARGHFLTKHSLVPWKHEVGAGLRRWPHPVAGVSLHVA